MEKTVTVSAELFNQLTAERVWLIDAVEMLIAASTETDDASVNARIHARSLLTIVKAD